MNPKSGLRSVASHCAFPVRLLAICAVALIVALAAGPTTAAFAQSTSDEGSTRVVKRGDSWTAIAEEAGISVAELQAANPQAVRANGWLLIGEEILIPISAQDRADQDDDASDEGVEVYVVGAGESWNSIAATLDIAVSELKAANPEAVRDDDVLYRGIRLIVPGQEDETGEADAAAEEEGEDEAAADAPEEAAAEDAADEEGSDEDAAGNEAGEEAPSEADGTPADEEVATEDADEEDTAASSAGAEDAGDEEDMAETYTVRPGDSWNSIARGLGVSAAALQAANPEIVRPGDVLLTGDELTIPADDAATDTDTATAMPACPETFAEYPEAIIAVLNMAEGGPEALATFLSGCEAQTADGIIAQDWTDDGVDDLLVIYTDPGAAEAGQTADLMIFNGVEGTEEGAGGFEMEYRARAAGDVSLLASDDANADGQADVIWIDTTCGASTCFDTVNVRSWDGSAWSDWTDGAITMAYANIDLEDVSEDGQGAEIVVTGGVYGSVGAGPQRSRIETWGSVEGAPYTLAEQTFSPSECLYHTVTDGNKALLNAAEEGFGAAEAFYTDAISNNALIKCWVRDNELDELRAFSYFRLALVAAYQDLPDVAADLTGALAELYPESSYVGFSQVWLDAYTASGDVSAACAEAAAFAEDNPETWEILADYGYTNPTFSAQDVCPVLDMGRGEEALEAEGEGAEEDGSESTTDGAEMSDATSAPDGVAAGADLADGEAEAGVDTGEADAQEVDTEEADTEEAGTEEAVVENETAVGAEDMDSTGAEEASLPECPPNVDRFARVLPDVLAAMEGDMAQVESWLASCDAVVEGEQVAATADLNADGIEDLVLFPTIVSDLGFGPGGSQGTVLVYHGQEEGSYVLAHDPEIYGQPTLLAIEDLNDDGRTELAWAVASCANFCVTEAQMVTWDGSDYVPAIEPGATIAEGTAYFEPLGAGAVGSGQALVLEGGVSNLADGGLATPHSEVWQSVDGAPFERVEWIYDRNAEGNDCLGLRLVEADIALQAADVLGYGEAIDLYTQALDPRLQACSLFGMPAEDELILLQGLATFRLMQAQALNGDADAAQATLLALQSGQPDRDYTRAAGEWLAAYVAVGDAAEACALVEPIFVENEDLWQITDHFGYNHPALPAQQICFVP